MKQQHMGFLALSILLIGGLVYARYAGTEDGRHAPAQSNVVIAGSLELEGAWVAETIGNQTATAAYLSIRNTSNNDDRLTGIATPAANRAELHRTVREDNVSRMEPVGILILPAGAEVQFAPGGLHIMVMGLATPLAAGDSIEMTVSFLEAGDVTLTVPVRSRADMMDMH